MLREIKQTIAARKRISLADLCALHHSTADALEPMLDLLVRKGQIRREEIRGAPRCAKACFECAAFRREDCIFFAAMPESEARNRQAE